MGGRALLLVASRSAWQRRFALALVVLAMGLATFLLLSVERLRHDVRANFSSAVSGTDLIVGARAGSVQLLLYAVFRIGQATHNIRYASVQAIERDPAVAWVVPLSLGDSHRGFPVVGTTPDYFVHFRYRDARPLAIEQGRVFEQVFDAVLGAEVAQRLGYRLGQPVVLRHGAGVLATADHADKPFTVSASSRAPAPRSTARCMSRWPGSRRSTWTGWPAYRCRAWRCRPTRSSATT